MTTEAFWLPKGNNLFQATHHTQGPWNPSFQHGGPPAALLVRQLEQCEPRSDMVLARVTFDIFRPIPIALFSASARILRPGRSVELIEALLEYEGQTVMRAAGWRIRLPLERPPAVEPIVIHQLPAQQTNIPTTPAWSCGFLTASEWRFVSNPDLPTTGTALAWTRLRHPLIANEATSPAQRIVAAADSVNGISSALRMEDWQFIPPELSVHMLRPALGEWICLDATTSLQPTGTGVATAKLYDHAGLVGYSAQALFIAQQAKNLN